MAVVLCALLTISCGKKAQTAEEPTAPEPAISDAAESANPPAAPLKKRFLVFPRDEAAHYEHPIEWWYFNAQLTDEQGRRYGFFFCALTTGRHLVLVNDRTADLIQTKDYYESLQASQTTLSVQSPSLKWKQSGTPFQHSFKYEYEGITADFSIKSKKKPFLVDGEGFVKMGTEGASFYYSLTDLEVTGTLNTGSGQVSVSGSGWLDHQWGEWDWVEDFSQWKWFAVKLDNGVDLMLFNIYKNKKLINSYCGYMDAEGNQVHRLKAELVTKDYYEDEFGGKWQRHVDIKIPGLTNTILTLTSDKDLQFVEPQVLWEGGMAATGTFKGQPVKGIAFGELNRPD